MRLNDCASTIGHLYNPNVKPQNIAAQPKPAMNTIAQLKDRSTTGLKAAINRLEISRNQYKKDLAETEDKLQIVQAAMKAMEKRYSTYRQDTQCPAITLLCTSIVQDISFIDTTIHNPATDLL